MRSYRIGAVKRCPVCGREFEGRETCPEDGAVLVVYAPVELEIGQVLRGSFRVDGVIARGGMGVVYEGTQLALDRRVAIKTILTDTANRDHVIQRFLREVKISSRLNHPNIVQVIDGGNTETGLCYLVMEYLEGSTLAEHVPQGKGLELGEAFEIFEQVCAGVREAHHHGLIHRDLKPENIFLVDRARGGVHAKVLDFGVAKALEGADSGLTLESTSLGTPGYMAPEQIGSAADADERSDVYSLGAVLYFMISGKMAFTGKTPSTVILNQLQGEPAEIDWSAAEIGDELRQVISKAVAREPGDRFQDTAEMLAALGAARSALPFGSGSGKKRRSAATVSAIAIGGILVVGVVAMAATSAFAWLGGGQSPPLVFGMSAAFSGPAKELGLEMRVGIQCRFDAHNAAGGWHGRKLVLKPLDDGYEPDRALANTRQLIDEGVLALIGCVGTPTAKVTIPVANEKRVPVLGSMTGAALLRKTPPDRYVFNYRASYAQEVEKLIGFLVGRRRIDRAKIAVFAQEDSFGDTVYTAVDKWFAGEAKPFRVGYARNTLAVDAAVRAITARRERVAAIIMVSTYKPATQFIKKVRGAGLDPVFALISFVGSAAFAEEMRQWAPDCMAGIIVTQVVPHPESAATGILRYREDLARYQPSEAPHFLSLEGYLAASLLIQALESRPAGDLSREDLVTALEGLSGVDIGIGVEVGFSANDHQASDVVWGTILTKDGTYEPLDL